MALGAVVDLGHNTLTGNRNTLTLAGVNASVGDKIVVGAGGGNSTATSVTFSTPDGNVWTTDISGPGAPGIFQGSCDVTVAMVNQTITATWNTTVNTDYLMAALKFSGAAAGLGSATPATTTAAVAAWRGATTFTTTGASERVIQFGLRAAVTTSAAAGSNTEVHDFASGARTMSSVYQDIAAGSVTNGGTWVSAGTWRAVGASYKASRSVAVTLAGTSSLTATVTPLHRLTLTLAGSSSLAATVTPLQRVTVTFAGTSSLTATVGFVRRFTLTLAGTSSLAATVTPYKRLTVTMAATSALAATVTPYHGFTLTLAGTSAFSATITRYQRISVSFAGSGSLTVTTTPYQRFTATFAGTSSLSATVTTAATRPITVTFTGTSSLTAALATGGGTSTGVGGGGISSYILNHARLPLPDCHPDDKECLRRRALIEEIRKMPEPVVVAMEGDFAEGLRRHRALRLQTQQDERELEQLILLGLV